MKLPKRLTVTELRVFVDDYAAALPNWQRVGADRLVRFNGPLAQSILFERLRTGDYRPLCAVRVLCAPSDSGGTATLAQFLSIRVREVSARQHSRLFPKVLAALRTEIKPSLDKPLIVDEVIDLLRDSNYPPEVYALACLLGALGRSNDCFEWIAKYNSALAALRLPGPPVGVEEQSFLANVKEWFANGEGRQRFDDVINEQKKRFLSG